MYSYVYDSDTGGIILNSSPTVFSKEPRPVWAQEMNLLGFHKYWEFDNECDVPYMWAESNVYWYHGVQIARAKGGSLYAAPELEPIPNERGLIPFSRENGIVLKPINVSEMCNRNKELINIIENNTVRKIIQEYEKFKNRLDIFHVAYSGGKDSTVLLDLVKKALPVGSFVVIFGDTGMEFPDTYETVSKVKTECEKDGTPFYIAQSHFDPLDSWKLFGPPARVLRWCCSVHKSTPQTLKMREITGKDDYIGLDFVGVRAHESVSRSRYDYEGIGKKQKGQYSYNPILEWTSYEVWLYIFINKLEINSAYKKGNSRAGCLFCPMGGGKGDYIQRSSYPDEVERYISIIKDMNSKDSSDEKALDSYVSNGGWNARKNGRDLTIASQRCFEEIIDGKYIITVTSPTTDWREWIKTIGEIPFEFDYTETTDGYVITCSAKEAKTYPNVFKKFKQVFKKASHCVGCRVCETNCRNGCISFDGGLSITDCIHCGQCHEIDDGCLVYHSVRTNNGEGIMKKESINSFANHAPKSSWVQEFFNLGNEYWNEGNNSLGKNQVPMFKRFLRECGVIDSKNKTTILFDIIKRIGWRDNTAWGLMLSNLAYNRQCRWYIENMNIGEYYDRKYISDLLVSDGVKKDDATSIINSYKRFCELPLGETLNWGYVEEDGRQIVGLCRTKCSINDNRIILYSLYLFAEKCNIGKEFNVSYLFDEEVERNGISPVRLFGIEDAEELRTILVGLTARYPDFINATYTNDLQSVSLRDKSSTDVLTLFEEEF